MESKYTIFCFCIGLKCSTVEENLQTSSIKKNIQNIFCSLKKKKEGKGGEIETVFEKILAAKNFKIDEKH